MKFTICEPNQNLADVLARNGVPIDRRCGGIGTCGRCRVQLLTGDWLNGGKEISAPAEVLACRTVLKSKSGVVDVPEESLAPQKSSAIVSSWNITEALPKTKEAVIGIDIGTTTIAAALVQGGEVIASETCFNPQSAFGDNVIARITASKEHLNELTWSVRQAIAGLVQKLGNPARIAVAGNTVMSCLFHGIDPTPIGASPFIPPCKEFPVRSGMELGAGMDVPVYTVPCISGYLGGDITAGLLETKPQEGELFIDIGTNCELVFHGKQQFTGAAAAAGPAFEGAGISCGMRAVKGAISQYRGEGDYTVIGDCEPQGLCGSAMTDVIAEERRREHLNDFGRIQPHAEALNITKDGQIRLTEGDLEQLLKAKAAVYAGITTLEEHCGCTATTLILAGGFARWLNLNNAAAIGMIPERAYRIAGNTSLAGAIRLASEPEQTMGRLLETARSVKETPLNSFPEFTDNFIDALMLP